MWRIQTPFRLDEVPFLSDPLQRGPNLKRAGLKVHGVGIVIGLAIADRVSAGDMVRVIALYGCLVVAVSALAVDHADATAR